MSETVVAARELRRHYEMKGETIRALDGVTLDIAEGEFMAIAGPSGSGKSTLLNLIGGLDFPTSGSVSVEGRNLAHLSKRERSELRRDRLGFVFQAYNLIPVLTVLENVEYVMVLQGVPRSERHEKAMAIIADVGLDGLASRRPNEISGGQQQRVAIARAIVSEPALVLADEPTANLDTARSIDLLDTMAALNRQRGVTFLFCTHDQMIMERASRLVRLRDGRVDSDERR